MDMLENILIHLKYQSEYYDTKTLLTKTKIGKNIIPIIYTAVTSKQSDIWTITQQWIVTIQLLVGTFLSVPVEEEKVRQASNTAKSVEVNQRSITQSIAAVMY